MSYTTLYMKTDIFNRKT